MGAQPSSPKGGRSAVRGRRSLHQIDEPSGITVEVPSSPAGRRGIGMSLQSPGSVQAAPFAPAPEPTDTPPRRCTPAWARPPPQAYGASSPNSFYGDLEAGPTHLEGGTADIEVIHAVSEPFRPPSKMSVESFESELEPSPSAASQADLRPISRASSSRGFGSSRPSSVCDSRPASARSKLGDLRRMSMGEFEPLPRDPSLVHAERMAKLTLEKLQQEDFITGREAWGASTPSTASPASISRATSSVSSGSRPQSSAASVSSSCFSTSSAPGEDLDAKQRLKDAQKRAKASMKALQSELKGSASATPARYSAWPSGCAVRVALVGNSSEQESLIATLLHYSSSSNSFEVKLEDGSTRIVPAECVTRARVRDRTAQSQSAGQSPSSGGVPSGLGASGYQAPVPHSQRTQMHRPPPLAENSPFQPEPQMLGQTHLLS